MSCPSAAAARSRSATRSRSASVARRSGSGSLMNLLQTTGDEFRAARPSDRYEHASPPTRARGPRRLRRAGRAPPPRAAGALLPHARLVRRRRGPGAGDVPARLAQARDVRRPLVVPRLALRHRHERVPRRDRAAARARGAAAPSFEVTWLRAVPRRLLDGVAARPRADAASSPRRPSSSRSSSAIQHMTPQSRAVLILRDVVGLPGEGDRRAARDHASPAVNSALQRARAVLARAAARARALEWAPGAEPDARRSRRCSSATSRATERADVDGAEATLAEEARFAMPPQPESYTAATPWSACWVEGGFGTEEFGQHALRGHARQPPAGGRLLPAPRTARGGRSRSTCCASRTATRRDRHLPARGSAPATACPRCWS